LVVPEPDELPDHEAHQNHDDDALRHPTHPDVLEHHDTTRNLYLRQDLPAPLGVGAGI
jgi:hypothetical protein